MTDNHDDLVTVHHADDDASIGAGHRIAPGVWRVPYDQLIELFSHGWKVGNRPDPEAHHLPDERDLVIERMGKQLSDEKAKSQEIQDRFDGLETEKDQMKDDMAAATETTGAEIKKLEGNLAARDKSIEKLSAENEANEVKITKMLNQAEASKKR